MEIIQTALEFEWDLGNLNKNIKKHEVTNEEAEEVFADEEALLLDDYKHSGSEKRFMLMGKTDRGRLLSLIYTQRGKKIRIISARSMNKKERRRYAAKEEI